MAQYSKYVRTGAVRIGCTATGTNSPEVMAFKNSDSTIVVVAHNQANASYNGRVVIGSNQIEYATTPLSIDDFYWTPVGVSVTPKTAITTKSSEKGNLAVCHRVMELNNSIGVGSTAYTVTGRRVSESSASRVTPGIYVDRPGINSTVK
jgi:hypothetical protein